MSHRKIGELLGNMVPITEHDVEEILQEQVISHRKFGEIAVALGLCNPSHVWQAWALQPSAEPPRVDLNELGVDAQAIGCLPREVAAEHCAIPIRVFDNLIVLAVSDPAARAVLQDNLISFQVAIVLADEDQIRQSIGMYYTASEAA